VKHQVFVSIGTPRTPEQGQFKTALLEKLRTRDLLPRTVGRNHDDTDSSHARPFDQICDLIGQSHGIVVVAYQKHFAREYEHDVLSPENRRVFAEMKLATAWNQVEAAIGYQAGIPMLLICEQGVHRDGVFDSEGIASPVMVSISPPALEGVVFLNTLQSWVNAVKKHAETHGSLPADTPEALTLGRMVQSLGKLSLQDAVVFYGAIAGTLGLAYGAGSWVTRNWHWIESRLLPPP
jgi:hypothetical protein